MKWTKINQKTGEVFKKGCNSLMPHDYISGCFRIVNNSFTESKLGWILTKDGKEIARFNTLKEAKTRAEQILPLAEWI